MKQAGGVIDFSGIVKIVDSNGTILSHYPFSWMEQYGDLKQAMAAATFVKMAYHEIDQDTVQRIPVKNRVTFCFPIYDSVALRSK